MVVPYAFLCVFLSFGTQCAVTKPSIIIKQPIQGKLGGEANLTCDGKADYRNTVLSFNNTKIVEKPGKFQGLHNGAFKILDIRPQDTGIYNYKQSSDDYTHLIHCIITLKINEETMIANTRSTVTMSCKVTAPMDIWHEVFWRRRYSSKTKTIVNNGSVSEFAKQSFSGRISASGKKLVIQNSEKGDSGKYICTVVFKDYSPHDNYYINLVVSMPSTNKPRTTEVIDKSPTSTPFSMSSMTKGATKQKSCAVKMDVYLPLLAILILFPFHV